MIGDPTLGPKVQALREEIDQLVAMVAALQPQPAPTHHVGSRRPGKVIYIAGAYTADNPQELAYNVHMARVAARQVADKGHTPLCPHTAFDMFTVDEWKWVMHHCLDVLHRVDAILLTNWEFSLGARIERYAAYALGRTVYYSIDDIPDVTYRPDVHVLEELTEIFDDTMFAQQTDRLHTQ